MKNLLRKMHLCVSVLVYGLLALVATGLVLGHFQNVAQNAEFSHLEAASEGLRTKLATYHAAHGSYPDSLQALTFAGSSQDEATQSYIRKMTYEKTDSGCKLSYNGTWYNSLLSLSDKGAASYWGITAK